jgi:hypothetical protein
MQRDQHAVGLACGVEVAAVPSAAAGPRLGFVYCLWLGVRRADLAQYGTQPPRVLLDAAPAPAWIIIPSRTLTRLSAL